MILKQHGTLFGFGVRKKTQKPKKSLTKVSEAQKPNRIGKSRKVWAIGFYGVPIRFRIPQ
jgi:hypothetical protein